MSADTRWGRRAVWTALVAALPLWAVAQVRGQDQPLGGRWDLTLWVESPAEGTQSVTGTVVLVEVRGAERPTYRGSFKLALSTIGAGPDAGPVLVVQNRDRSYRIELNPAAEGGHLEGTGAWSRGVIAGRWKWSAGSGPAGRFELRSGR